MSSRNCQTSECIFVSSTVFVYVMNFSSYASVAPGSSYDFPYDLTNNDSLVWFDNE